MVPETVTLGNSTFLCGDYTEVTKRKRGLGTYASRPDRTMAGKTAAIGPFHWSITEAQIPSATLMGAIFICYFILLL